MYFQKFRVFNVCPLKMQVIVWQVFLAPSQHKLDSKIPVSMTKLAPVQYGIRKYPSIPLLVRLFSWKRILRPRDFYASTIKVVISYAIIWWVLVWLLLLVHVVVPDVVCWCWCVPCHHATHINSTLPHRVHYRVFIFYQLFQSIMLETSIYYSGHTRLPQVCLQLYKQGWVSQVVILSYNFL